MKARVQLKGYGFIATGILKMYKYIPTTKKSRQKLANISPNCPKQSNNLYTIHTNMLNVNVFKRRLLILYTPPQQGKNLFK